MLKPSITRECPPQNVCSFGLTRPESTCLLQKSVHELWSLVWHGCRMHCWHQDRTYRGSGLVVTSPTTLHDQMQASSPPALRVHQCRRTLLWMCSMDPQLYPGFVFWQNWVQKQDLLIIFFCSFLSRTDVKNTMVRIFLQTRPTLCRWN